MHNTGRLPAIKEGEIWWCAMGENIGVEINGKNEIAVLAQVRVFSVSRLYSKMGRVDETDLARIKEGFRSLYCR